MDRIENVKFGFGGHVRRRRWTWWRIALLWLSVIGVVVLWPAFRLYLKCRDYGSDWVWNGEDDFNHR